MRLSRLSVLLFLAGINLGPVPLWAQDSVCYLPERPIDYRLTKNDPLYEFARQEFQDYLEDMETYMRCLEQERANAFLQLKEDYEEFQRIYGADAVFHAPVPDYSKPQ